MCTPLEAHVPDFDNIFVGEASKKNYLDILQHWTLSDPCWSLDGDNRGHPKHVFNLFVSFDRSSLG